MVLHHAFDGGAVTVESPVDYSYFTGHVDLTSYSTYPKTDSVTVTFYDSTGKAVWNGNCHGNGCDQPVDVTGLPDGRYEVQAISTGFDGNSPRPFDSPVLLCRQPKAGADPFFSPERTARISVSRFRIASKSRLPQRRRPLFHSARWSSTIVAPITRITAGRLR